MTQAKVRPSWRMIIGSISPTETSVLAGNEGNLLQVLKWE
jgi:hypothetical protein